ncbi:sensor domain-containing protein [Mycobacterium sp. pUA109]|uniref:sensor domain-containing protein n=1 Tax=Mycobacterium sp. pUA109 TaxID=3238982 RepID=UPI00351BCEF7
MGVGALVLVAALGSLYIWRTTPAATKTAPPGRGEPLITTTTRPVPADRLDAILLSPAEIGTLMRTPNLHPDPTERDMISPTYTVSRPECLSALHAVVAPAYQGSDWTAVYSQYSAEPGTSIDHEVRQGVVAYPSADQADAFLQSSLAKWKSCVGQTVTVTNADGMSRRVTFENLIGVFPKISLFSTIDAPQDWACQRAMRSVSNVVIDVGVCGRGITDDASRIAYQMSGNVDKIS